MKINNSYILTVIVAVALVVVMIQNHTLKRSLKTRTNQIETERKESQERIDSVRKVMELELNSYISIIKGYENQKDSLLKRYRKALERVDKRQSDITDYLNATDSMRFAKFKQLITEVDKI